MSNKNGQSKKQAPSGGDRPGRPSPREIQRAWGMVLGALTGGSLGAIILREAAKVIVAKIGGHGWTMTVAIALGALIGGGIGRWSSKLLNTNSERRSVTPYGLVVVWVFIILWILPIIWVGGAKKGTPGFPHYLRNQHRIACLFTHSSSVWRSAHYQVKFAGSDKWVEGFEPGYFDQSIFGHRTRFNRLIGQSIRGGRRGEGRRREIAEFIKKRHHELKPAEPEIEWVRYIRVSYKVGGQHCMAPGNWTKPLLKDINEKRWRVVKNEEWDLRGRVGKKVIVKPPANKKPAAKAKPKAKLVPKPAAQPNMKPAVQPAQKPASTPRKADVPTTNHAPVKTGGAK